MQLSFGRCSLASLFALSFLSGAPPAQTTWFVAAGAPAPGLGTEGSPYASLQYAIDRPTTVESDTLLVAPGTYVEQITLTKQIHVRSPRGPRVTFLVRPAGASGAHVFMNFLDPELAASRRLEGFTITSPTPSSLAVNLHGGTLARCLVTGNSGLAVQSLYGPVQSCTITDNGSGVSFATFGETTLADSIVWGNGTDILGIGGFGTARYTTFGTNPNGFMSSAGPGNESADPLFADAAEGHDLLLPASSCIDTADAFLPHDPDGTRADRGALPPLRVFEHFRR
jgi:hypothetical protein